MSLLSLLGAHEVRRYGKLKKVSKALWVLTPKGSNTRPPAMQKNFKYLTAISVFFVSILLISNVASSKIVDLKWFTFDGGTLLFPLSYIFDDILTEVYGYKESRKTIWLGFFSALMMSVIFIIVDKLPPAAGWTEQAAFDAILGLTPRIVCASLIAYFFGEFANSFVHISKFSLSFSTEVGTAEAGTAGDAAAGVAASFPASPAGVAGRLSDGSADAAGPPVAAGGWGVVIGCVGVIGAVA